MVKRMSTYTGLIGKIGGSNAKDIPIPKTTYTMKEIERPIMTLLKQIRQIQNPNAKLTHAMTLSELIKELTNKSEKATREITKRIHEAHDNDATCDEQHITVADVQKARKKLKGTVISILDKANANLVVM